MIRSSLRSAAIAAALFAADLVLLVLFLNPSVTLRKDAAALALSIFLPYATLGTLALWSLALLAAVLIGWPRGPRPPIPGLPWFTSMSVIGVGAAAALFWLNLVSYRHSLPLPALPALAASAVALTMAALVLVAVGVDTLLFPTRGRGVSAALVVLAAAAAVVIPMAARPAPAPRATPVPVATETVTPLRRVILVGVDGLGPDQLRDALAGGSAPAFAQMVRRGAHGPLATLRPTEGPPIWTTVFTGRLPRDHGVKSFAAYRLRGSDTVYELLPKYALVTLLERAGLVATSPVTSASRERLALWNALNAFGIEAGIVRFWGTHPPEPVKGFMLSHYFHLLRGSGTAARALHPPDLEAAVAARAVAPADVDAAMVGEFVDLAVPEGTAIPWRRELVEGALAPDLTYQRAGEVLRAAYDPPFFATYFYGLDRVGHAFTRFADPDRFGDVRPEERRRYGHVVERYTAYVARAVGDLAAGLRPGEVLIVVSGYGMRPVPPWRRAWEAVAGDPWISGTHADAPDGVLLAVGDGIRPGATLDKASVLDVTPTILYLMGLPVARDMEGRVLAEIVDERFARAHPVTYIPSYESLAVMPKGDEFLPGLPSMPEESP
jgi:predicted AlkP superfamily pyrophosphatase or phosphodiesterase